MSSVSDRAALIALLLPTVVFVGLPVLAGLDGGSGPIAFTTGRIARTFALQLVFSATLGWWLWRLGWRPHRNATSPFGWTDILRGIGLWVGTVVAITGWALICQRFLPQVFAVAAQTRFAGRPDLFLVVAWVLFNAVFEEMLWLGLGVATFRRFGVVPAALLSIGLRLLVHVYQGPLALVTILPMGVVFTGYYVWTGRLWPVVVAHAFQDLLSLGRLATGASRQDAV